MEQRDSQEFKALIKAVEEFLEVEAQTIFHDCGIRDPKDSYHNDDDCPDDLPIDGGSCYLTVGHIRRIRTALLNVQQLKK